MSFWTTSGPALVRFLLNYIQRHTHPLNRLLHLAGVPLTFVVPVVLALRGQPWWLVLASFVGGYVLQFVGHAIEGNDAGEVVVIKKWLGRPYREFAPGRDPSSGAT
jgi:hypothetical protein